MSKLPCKCVSHRCRGVPRSRKTVEKHAHEDAALALTNIGPRPSTGENIGYSCPFYPALYDYHPAATTPLYENSSISKLDHIYIEFRKFVSHPSHTKEAVTESFKCDKLLKLPKPNESCGSFEEARSVIEDFLVPLQKYHCCPNDCVIYRGSIQAAKVKQS